METVPRVEQGGPRLHVESVLRQQQLFEIVSPRSIRPFPNKAGFVHLRAPAAQQQVCDLAVLGTGEAGAGLCWIPRDALPVRLHVQSKLASISRHRDHSSVTCPHLAEKASVLVWDFHLKPMIELSLASAMSSSDSAPQEEASQTFRRLMGRKLTWYMG